MEKLFVNYDIAQVLEELGFDEPCFGYYTESKLLHLGGRVGNIDDVTINKKYVDDICQNDNACLAPLYQQVISWFREEHQIYIGVLPYRNNEDNIELCRYYTLVIDDEDLPSIFCNADDLGASRDNYNTPEEARDAAIQKTIEIVKNRLDLKK